MTSERRIVLSNGTTTLPEATDLGSPAGGWLVRFDGVEKDSNYFSRQAGWTAKIFEPPRPLPTKPLSVVRPFPTARWFLVLNTTGEWVSTSGSVWDIHKIRDQFRNWAELKEVKS